MGARQFLTVGRGNNVGAAFWREVRQAIEEHGDDGYTGTIAEKFEYVLVAPTCPEKSIGLATWALNDGPANDDSSPDIPKHLQPIVAEIASLIADKWGPAVALQLTDEETRDHLPLGEDKLFLFFGWAPY